MNIDTSQPFSRADALSSGITVRHLTGSEYRRIFQDVYVSARVPLTVVRRARGALLHARPGSYASHHTAARLWGAWAPGTTLTHISTPAEARSRRRGVSTHRAPKGVTPLKRKGVMVSPPTQVFLELAALGIDLVDLVAVGDSLVKAGAVTAQALLDAASSGRSGCRLASRAAAYVRKGVDSVMETRLRMLIVIAGLPEPTVNKILRDEDGIWVHRIDICYASLMLAIEYDGRQHAQNSRQWREDLRRREILERLGWTLIVVVAEDIFQQPAETLDRIRRALRDRGETAGRRRPPAEWHRCFPAAPAAA